MKKILAIDDVEINLDLLFQVVKMYFPGFHFLKATTGTEGIYIAKKEKPEIILLDILMPGLDGYEVCKILKRGKLTQHIPILMISALGQNSAERIKGLNAGADAFISKPFNQVELRAQIDVALRIKKVEDLLRSRNNNLEHFIKGQTNKYIESEERFLQIAEHAREFYWEVDKLGYFTYVSPVIEKTLHVLPSEIILKKNYLKLFQLEKNNLKNQAIIQVFNNSKFNDLELELNVKNKNIWLSVNGFSIINKQGESVGKRGVCYDITTRKQAEIELKKNVVQIQNYQKKLKKLNTELTLVEEKERRRIAENLHDSLGQTLSLAFMKLSSIVDESFSPHAKKTVTETSELLDIAILESRRLTYDLSPPILYELGLIPAIRWKLEQIEKKHKIKTIIIGENVQLDIKKEFDIFIYRIVSELFTNVVKHAQASLVELEISNDSESYFIVVRDNGVGFKKRNSKKEKENIRYGLMSITERIESIKGSFEIESKPGMGAEAKIIIPISQE